VKIYSMTATFGKLEHQTLELKPGLNIIEAPNEWGKSTWCAFLVAMLYGIDTKARSTQTALAEKERYAPWSGALMEGKMELCWNGRDITIERRTKGRLLLGEFRAYETESGLDVPELTASNCGMELLGVERSVFLRAGFLRMSDLPVTQDDALRRRLNNLVTTGDESGAGEKLAQTLKDLKNKCRSSRGGLLPQAEAERNKLEEQLHTLQDLNTQAQHLKDRQQELEKWIEKLENHKVALQFAQAKEETQHIQEAMALHNTAQEQLKAQTKRCSNLPSAEEAERTRTGLQRLHNESMSLQMEQQMLPGAPTQPACLKCFEGVRADAAISQAKADTAEALENQKKKKSQKTILAVGIVLLTLAILAAAGGFLLTEMKLPLLIAGGGCAALGLALLLLGSVQKKKAAAAIAGLCAKYETEEIARWLILAEEFAQGQAAFEQELFAHQEMMAEFMQRLEKLLAQLQELTGGEAIGVCLEKWDAVAKEWKILADMQRDFQRTQSQIAALQAMAKDVPAPTQPDELTQTLPETDALLNNAAFEQKQNQMRLGQYQGQADALGQESVLRQKLKQVRARIEKLEETYQALEIAQQALSTATNELQRRFAPRISKRAQELFEKLTDGRYRKVALTEDLSVHTGTEEENTLRPSLWRSDGTVDQLYLALRLAVAEELTPDAPLVLDDAMVRFDDKRLAVALDILEEMADNKQVILFTCQSREKKLQGDAQ